MISFVMAVASFSQPMRTVHVTVAKTATVNSLSDKLVALLGNENDEEAPPPPNKADVCLVDIWSHEVFAYHQPRDASVPGKGIPRPARA